MAIFYRLFFEKRLIETIQNLLIVFLVLLFWGRDNRTQFGILSIFRESFKISIANLPDFYSQKVPFFSKSAAVFFIKSMLIRGDKLHMLVVAQRTSLMAIENFSFEFGPGVFQLRKELSLFFKALKLGFCQNRTFIVGFRLEKFFRKRKFRIEDNRFERVERLVAHQTLAATKGVPLNLGVEKQNEIGRIFGS